MFDSQDLATIEKTISIEPVSENAIRVSYPLGDSCHDSNYHLTATVHCNEKKKGNNNDDVYFNFFDLYNQIETNEKCELNIDIYTNKQCVIQNYYAGYNFCIKFRFILGPILMIMGIYFSILGAKYDLITEILGNGLALSIIIFSIIFNLFVSAYEHSISLTNLSVFLVIIISFIVGAVLGFVFWKIKKHINLYILSSGIGYLLGIFLFNLIFRNLNYNVDTNFWMSVIVLSITGAFFPYYVTKYKNTVIISTAFLGGYLIIRGFALLFGKGSGFPSENIVFDLLTRNEVNAVNDYKTFHIYLYLPAWIIISVGSVYFQIGFNSRKYDSDYAPEN